MRSIQQRLSDADALPFNKQVLLLALTGLGVLLLATPMPLLRGILFCEESTTYLRFAREAAPIAAILAPHQGYYSLVPNVATLLAAHFIGLMYIPVFLAWASLLVHATNAWLAATAEVFRTVTQRLVAVLLAIFVMGSARELDGTINSQYFLGIGALLIFLSSADRHRVARSLILLTAGLTGVFACMLTPLFILRAWRQRSRMAVLQATLLVACSFVQAAVVLNQMPFSVRSATSAAPIAERASGFVNNSVILPFATRLVYAPAARVLSASTSHGLWRLLPLLGAVFYLVLGAAMRTTGRLPRLLLLAGIAVTAMSLVSTTTGGQDGLRAILGDGDRYYIVGNALVAFAILLAYLRSGAVNWSSRFLRLCLCMLLLSGSVDYARYWRSNQYAPSWKPQVDAWRLDSATPLRTAALHWKDAPLFYAPKALRSDLPPYLFDSTLAESVRGSIDPACFVAHTEQAPAGMCYPDAGAVAFAGSVRSSSR